jgi:hypothetical protein
MTTQWFRRFQLVIGAAGEGVSIDNINKGTLKFHFEVQKSLLKEPNVAKFEIYNLNPRTVLKIEEEYTDVIFKAGYEGTMRTVFEGNTQYVSTYPNKTEWITELTCGDGDFGYRTAYVNKSFSAGTSDEAIVDHCIAQFGNVTRGELQLVSPPSMGGQTFSAPARDVLDEIARSNGCNWSIQDGELQMVRTDAMLNVDQAVVLTPTTGLLRAAERTDKGITATCLLNPNITVNSAIRLDNSAIKTQDRTRKSITKAQRGRPVDLNADGLYKVFKVKHSGDTRANDWLTEVLCVGIGQPIPTDAPSRNAVPIEGVAG